MTMYHYREIQGDCILLCYIITSIRPTYIWSQLANIFSQLISVTSTLCMFVLESWVLHVTINIPKLENKFT